jgi:site-specific recombinase XerD
MTGNQITQADQKAIATQDFVNRWLEYEALRGQSERTIETYKRGFNRFGRWLIDQGITAPKAADLARFRGDLSGRYAVQTVNLTLSAVRSFYRYLVTAGAIDYSPFEGVPGIKRPKSRRHKRSALTRAEVRAVLDTCDPNTAAGSRDLAIIMLMAYCGLRTIEVHRADINDLGSEGERLVLYVQGKGHTEADAVAVIPRDQERIIRAWIIERQRLDPISKALFISLSPRSKGLRLSTRAISDIVTGHYEAAGVAGDNKTTHSLRHTAITQVIKAGGTLMQAQALARHESPDTTTGYIHEVNRVENPPEDLIQYSY